MSMSGSSSALLDEVLKLIFFTDLCAHTSSSGAKTRQARPTVTSYGACSQSPKNQPPNSQHLQTKLHFFVVMLMIMIIIKPYVKTAPTCFWFI